MQLSDLSRSSLVSEGACSKELDGWVDCCTLPDHRAPTPLSRTTVAPERDVSGASPLRCTGNVLD